MENELRRGFIGRYQRGTDAIIVPYHNQSNNVENGVIRFIESVRSLNYDDGTMVQCVGNSTIQPNLAG